MPTPAPPDENHYRGGPPPPPDIGGIGYKPASLDGLGVMAAPLAVIVFFGLLWLCR